MEKGEIRRQRSGEGARVEEQRDKGERGTRE